jgi:hypothetical protein
MTDYVRTSSYLEILEREHRERMERLWPTAKPVVIRVEEPVPHLTCKPEVYVDTSSQSDSLHELSRPPPLKTLQNRKLFGSHIPRRLLTKTCISLASDNYSVNPEEVLSPNRGVKPLVDARQLAIYLTTRASTMSSPDVGKLFGRDHSTVLYSVTKVQARMDAEPEFCATVESLVGQIRNCRSSSQGVSSG